MSPQRCGNVSASAGVCLLDSLLTRLFSENKLTEKCGTLFLCLNLSIHPPRRHLQNYNTRGHEQFESQHIRSTEQIYLLTARMKAIVKPNHR